MEDDILISIQMGTKRNKRKAKEFNRRHNQVKVTGYN